MLASEDSLSFSFAGRKGFDTALAASGRSHRTLCDSDCIYCPSGLSHLCLHALGQSQSDQPKFYCSSEPPTQLWIWYLCGKHNICHLRGTLNCRFSTVLFHIKFCLYNIQCDKPLASFPGLPPLFCITGLGVSAKAGVNLGMRYIPLFSVQLSLESDALNMGLLAGAPWLEQS